MNRSPLIWEFLSWCQIWHVWAHRAGGGAIEGLQAGADKTIETAKKNVEEAGSRLGDLFKGNNNAGDLSTSSIEDAANNVRGGIEDLVNNGPSKVKSDVETTGDKVKSDIASTQGVTRQASNKAGNVADQVQDKASDAVEGGKDFLSNLKDKITVSHHSPVTFRAHMESLLKDNVNMKFGERSRHLWNQSVPSCLIVYRPSTLLL